MARTSEELQKGKICDHCGASLEIYPVRLTRGIAKTLIKLRRLTVQLNKPEIYLEHDDVGTEFEFDHNERRNMSRLRFLGLARYTESHAGVWFITKRGYAFLRGEPVPVRQYVFRNKIVDRLREDHITVTLSQVFKRTDVPYFEQVEDIRSVTATESDLKTAVEQRQAQLVDVPAVPKERRWL